MQTLALYDNGFAIVFYLHPHRAEGTHGGHIVAAAQKAAYGGSAVCNGAQHYGTV
jgi:hypothetical protein